MSNKISRRNFLRKFAAGAVLFLSGNEYLNGQKRIWTRNFIPVNSKPIKLPNLIAVSLNEQYIAFPVDAHGKLNRKNINVVVMDAKGNDIKKIGPLERIFSLEINSKGKVAYSTGAFNSNSEIGLLPGELIIRDARRPKFSSNGDLLAYENDRGITLKKLEDKGERYLSVGRIIGFSPNSQKLAYVSSYKTLSTIGNEYFLEVYDLNDRNTQRLFSVTDTKSFIFPFWLGNKHIGFQMMKREGDSEIYVSNLNGDLEQITDNGLEEFNPQVRNDKIFYALETKDFGKYDFCFSEKKDNRWVSQKIRGVGLNAPYFGIARDNLIYVGKQGNLYMRSLEPDSEPIDLSEKIIENLEISI